MNFLPLWSRPIAISTILLLPAMMAAGQNTPVQIDISGLLNDRVIFTQLGGQLQPALHALDTSDKSALITREAAASAQSGELTALPDSDLFAETSRHPAIKLHYAQSGSSLQVHRSAARNETYSFDVPNQRYRRLQLFFISAQGETPLAVRLIYADDATGQRTASAPDFRSLPSNSDPRWFVLTGDFGTVDLHGKVTEAAHHYLDGFDLNPDPTKKLLKVEITKQDSSSVLSFFGATGLIAESGSSRSKTRRARR
jgi:hypothetical protein